MNRREFCNGWAEDQAEQALENGASEQEAAQVRMNAFEMAWNKWSGSDSDNRQSVTAEGFGIVNFVSVADQQERASRGQRIMARMNRDS